MDALRRIVRQEAVTGLVYGVVGAVGGLLKPERPFPGSDESVKGLMDKLQPRSATPDIDIRNLPHYEGVNYDAI